jgi:site-specific DNA-methyltransferase (adenine-specific)
MTYEILLGNNLDILPTLADNTVDSIVTDPPYELGFMGKKWDSSGIAYSVELWQQCLRVLKPGGHLLSFGGTRTYHRVAVAIEDAGFELRDSIAWLYGSGFPKSMDVSKAIDKAAGAERQVIGTKMASPKGISQAETRSDTAAGAYGGEVKEIDITAPATPEAKQWEGWGTALKPAFEPVIVARKPLIGTVAENVLTYGTGALNIDASRIEAQDQDLLDAAVKRMSGNAVKGQLNFAGNKTIKPNSAQGRWPANIILDPYTAELVDQQSGDRPGGNFPTQRGAGVATGFGAGKPTEGGARKMNDSGGASRFFYIAKTSKRDRNEGLDTLPEIQTTGGGGLTAELREDGSLETASAGGKYGSIKAKQTNFHPTVKPTMLMEYLIKLVTPLGGTVLDPFTGSGSTGKAAILNGFSFIGIELTPDYLPIIEGRLKHAEAEFAKSIKETEEQEQEKLF